jgi:hypothetical protein
MTDANGVADHVDVLDETAGVIGVEVSAAGSERVSEIGSGDVDVDKGLAELVRLVAGVTCSLATAALIAVFGVPDAAKVPDGSFMSAMYPNKPLSRDPQRSGGYPGHRPSQESVGTVLAG